MRKRRFIVPVFVAVLAASMHGESTTDTSRDVLEHLSKSTVFIRTHRIVQNKPFPTTGSGFFIHPDGFILTNWHVVADQIEIPIRQEMREINAKVLQLNVIVASGAAGERELPGKIVAMDRERDLALIKVQYTPPEFIEVSELDDVNVGDSILIAGFPFGDVLMRDSPSSQNPAVTVSRGMISSLRYSKTGEFVASQMDIGLNPGNSGGPVINEQGHLVGVVYSMVYGGQSIGFAVSPPRIRGFLARKGVKISFQPGVILAPPEPIHVTAEAVLTGSGADSGRVLLEGSDIETVSFDLEPTERGFAGDIIFPERLPGRPQTNRYIATVILSSPGKGEILRRRFALDSVPDSFGKLRSRRDPTDMMKDRQTFINELNLKHFLEDGNATGKPTRKKRLADVGKEFNVRKDADGTIVLDNRSVSEIGGPNLNDRRFQFIKNPDLRVKVAKYDQIREKIYVLQKMKREALESYSFESLIYAFDVDTTLRELTTERRELATALNKKHVRWCTDEGVYIVAKFRSYGRCSGDSLH